MKQRSHGSILVITHLRCVAVIYQTAPHVDNEHHVAGKDMPHTCSDMACVECSLGLGRAGSDDSAAEPNHPGKQREALRRVLASLGL
jgi:hypothetical protein